VQYQSEEIVNVRFAAGQMLSLATITPTFILATPGGSKWDPLHGQIQDPINTCSKFFERPFAGVV
jgi:hypothetical protein